MQILVVAAEMFVRLALPKGNDLRRQSPVDFVCGKRIPAMKDITQSVAGHRPDDDVGVVRHYDSRAQLVALAVKELNCSRHEIGKLWPA